MLGELLPESAEPPPLVLAVELVEVVDPPEPVELLEPADPVDPVDPASPIVVGRAVPKPVVTPGSPHAPARLAATSRRAALGKRNIARAYRKSPGLTTPGLGLRVQERLDLVQRQPVAALGDNEADGAQRSAGKRLNVPPGLPCEIITGAGSRPRRTHNQLVRPETPTASMRRGRAVAVLKDGRVVVVGLAEVRGTEPDVDIYLRTVATRYEGKGTRVKVWIFIAGPTGRTDPGSGRRPAGRSRRSSVHRCS